MSGRSKGGGGTVTSQPAVSSSATSTIQDDVAQTTKLVTAVIGFFDLSAINCPGKLGKVTCKGRLEMMAEDDRTFQAVIRCVENTAKAARACRRTFSVNAVLELLSKKGGVLAKAMDPKNQTADGSIIPIPWFEMTVAKLNDAAMDDDEEELKVCADKLVQELKVKPCVAVAASLTEFGRKMESARVEMTINRPAVASMMERDVAHGSYADTRPDLSSRVTYAQAVLTKPMDKREDVAEAYRAKMIVRRRVTKVHEQLEGDKDVRVIYAKGIDTRKETAASFRRLIIDLGADQSRLLWTMLMGNVKAFYVVPSYEEDFKRFLLTKFRDGEDGVEILDDFDPKRAAPAYVQEHPENEVKARHYVAKMRYARQLRYWYSVTKIPWLVNWVRAEIIQIDVSVLAKKPWFDIPTWEERLKVMETSGRDADDTSEEGELGGGSPPSCQ